MAAYKIAFKSSVEKDFAAIPPRDLKKILARIEGLVEDPRPLGCEKLTGQDRYRLRQGRYRILYTVQDKAFLIVLVAVAVQRPQVSGAGPVGSWICYYGADRLPEPAVHVDLVVLDGACHRDLVRRDKGRPLYLAYVSIGEVAVGGPWWERVGEASFLQRYNGFWNAWTVDVTDPNWQDLVIGAMVPAALAKGFDGIFIDGVDQALGLTTAGSQQWQRRRDALAGLIGRVRKAHSGIQIALNRGLDLLDKVATHIDFLVLEGLSSVYDPDAGQYRPVALFDRDQVLGRLKQGLRTNPGLPVLSLDYAPDPGDELAAEAVAFAREKGFVPCVSTWRLDAVFALPEAQSKEQQELSLQQG